MKKVVSLILALVMCLSLCACATPTPTPTPCETCNNEKNVPCPYCIDGMLKCTYCLGNGTITCSQCGGDGETVDLTCPTCDGTGGVVNPFTWEFFECKSCGGLGVDLYASPESCLNCRGVGVIEHYCPFCSDTGLTGDACGKCGGEGYVTCPDCAEAE